MTNKWTASKKYCRWHETAYKQHILAVTIDYNSDLNEMQIADIAVKASQTYYDMARTFIIAEIIRFLGWMSLFVFFGLPIVSWSLIKV